MTGYAGDVSPEEAWNRLKENPEAVLLDVRTRAEWNFVGVPELSSLGKQPALVEWQRFPDGIVDADFVAKAAAAGIAPETEVLILCRSGGRSVAAAKALTAAGYGQAFNVLEGFEGDRDGKGHRNSIGGWRHAGLPWVQG